MGNKKLRFKSIYMLWSPIHVNIDSCSKDWKKIHCNVSIVHLWMVKLPMNFLFLYTFLFLNFCPRTVLFHDRKKKHVFLFLNSCLSVSAIENTCHWIYGDCKVGWHSLPGTEPRIHAETSSQLPCPGLGKGAALASVSRGPGFLLYPNGLLLHLLLHQTSEQILNLLLIY